MEYLIVANGLFLSQPVLKEVANAKIIIALDGAADRLTSLSILPDLVLGDFDSIQEKTLYPQEKMIWTPDPNYTDLQKALQFLEQISTPVTAIHIVCATGGRMDHEQANIRALQTFYKSDRPIFLHTHYQSLFVACDQKNIPIVGQAEDYCGFFGLPQATMYCHYGLAYGEGVRYELFSGHDSVSNRLIGQKGALIDIEGAALIVHPPMFNAQRHYWLPF